MQPDLPQPSVDEGVSVFVVVISVRGVPMSIVQVIDVFAVFDLLVTAIRAVGVFGVFVSLVISRSCHGTTVNLQMHKLQYMYLAAGSPLKVDPAGHARSQRWKCRNSSKLSAERFAELRFLRFVSSRDSHQLVGILSSLIMTASRPPAQSSDV